MGWIGINAVQSDIHGFGLCHSLQPLERRCIPVWKDSLLEHIYYDGRGAVDDMCEVKFDEDRLFVSYEESDGVVIYEGKSLGAGHYILEAVDGDGRATLHMIEGSRILEGFWLEDDYRGFWRITLDWYLEDNPKERRRERHLRLV